MTHFCKAVCPVIRLGARFLPATKTVPKEMLPLIDRPLIQSAAHEARAAGIEQFIFITLPAKVGLKGYFNCNITVEGKLATAGKNSLLAVLRAFARFKTR